MGKDDRYKWVALSNTTLGVLIYSIDASIVIISLPAIFRGIGLDPLDPGNIGYLLWLIIGYLLVTAVLVVALGRLGDMYGRVRMYNLGFVIFSAASLALSLDPMRARAGALWLIGWRIVQAVGGSMLMANSAAILTDAFPAGQRGMALGVNQITALAGQFLGLLAGGLLAAIDWRAIFWVSVPVGVTGTIWSYTSLRELGVRRRARIDWAGNLTFAAGTALILAAMTYGIQPYAGHATGWANPRVLGAIAAGFALLGVFAAVEVRVREPMFHLGLFRIRAFATGNLAALLVAIARGGLQFMLIIWLQGIWLPLHGYRFEQTPLWAGIYMLPLTAGFLLAGPASGYLSDRFGARILATTGLVTVAVAFVGLLLLPVDFSYPFFAVLLLASGAGQGMFSAPNTSAVMGSVPPDQRGVASGMRATFQNAGTSLSIGVFFSLMIAGLSRTLPQTLDAGLRQQGVPAQIAASVAHLPPVSTLFAAFLGTNPVAHLLAPTGVLDRLPPANAAVLTGPEFFPRLISTPFHHGLVVVFTGAAGMALVAALVSLLRGRRPANTAAVSPPGDHRPANTAAVSPRDDRRQAATEAVWTGGDRRGTRTGTPSGPAFAPPRAAAAAQNGSAPRGSLPHDATQNSTAPHDSARSSTARGNAAQGDPDGASPVECEGMLEGAVIAESLREGASLDGLELVIHKISRGPVTSATEYQPKAWTLIEFSADTDPDALAERFAAVLDGPGWYVDFRTETTTYVAYPGRVFRYRRGDPAGREEAQAYGRTVGVPEPQLDWAR